MEIRVRRAGSDTLQAFDSAADAMAAMALAGIKAGDGTEVEIETGTYDQFSSLLPVYITFRAFKPRLDVNEIASKFTYYEAVGGKSEKRELKGNELIECFEEVLDACRGFLSEAPTEDE
tara:strand:- start:30 stop:386 length:357 start_codon:yes stop_codon:yes gene_type:complete